MMLDFRLEQTLNSAFDDFFVFKVIHWARKLLHRRVSGTIFTKKLLLLESKMKIIISCLAVFILALSKFRQAICV